MLQLHPGDQNVIAYQSVAYNKSLKVHRIQNEYPSFAIIDTIDNSISISRLNTFPCYVYTYISYFLHYYVYEPVQRTKSKRNKI